MRRHSDEKSSVRSQVTRGATTAFFSEPRRFDRMLASDVLPTPGSPKITTWTPGWPMASTICWICSRRPAKTALWLTGIAGVKTEVSLARRDSASAGRRLWARRGVGGTAGSASVDEVGAHPGPLRRPEDDFDEAEADAVALFEAHGLSGADPRAVDERAVAPFLFLEEHAVASSRVMRACLRLSVLSGSWPERSMSAV